MGTNAPGGNGINGNILITILNGDISANTLTDTVQGFLLSGSLTTDEGIGDNVGVTGANIVGNPYTGTNGTYVNLPTTTLGGGTGMTVNVTIAASTVTTITIVNGGSGYSIGEFITIQNSELIAQGADPGVTVGNLDSDPLTAADLTGGGTPYMLNFNPSPVSSSFGIVPDSQKLLVGGPQLALYHAYNTTVSQSLFNTNLPQTSNNTLGAGTLLWTTSGSDPANSNNYMTWTPDGSDAQSYQDTNIPFKIERGDVIRVEGIKNISDAATNSSSSINIEEDFVVERVVPYYYSSSYSDGQQNRNSLSGLIQKDPELNTNLTNDKGNFAVQNGNIFTWTGFIGGPTLAQGNPGRINTLINFDFSSAGNYNAGQSYATTDGTGTGATMRILTTNPAGTGQPTSAIIDNPGTGYTPGDTLEFKTPGAIPPGAAGATAEVSGLLDTGITLTRNGVVLTDWNSGASSPGGGGKIEVVNDGIGILPGWATITLSEGYGFLPGDVITIPNGNMVTAGNWYPDNFSTDLPTSSPSSDLLITIQDQILGNQTFNNNFTVGVDVNYAGSPTIGPSGSVAGYHLYEKGEVALNADTFIQVTPDPNITLNGLLLGEVKKFTIRRQIEADDKVMIKNINPPSGSKGIETPSGQGFLIPNDFSEVQKSNALNIINQLKAKNAFNKPSEPGITDGGNSIIVQGSGSDTIINIP